MPNLILLYPVKGREVSGSQQKVDAGGVVPLALEVWSQIFRFNFPSASVGLPEIASFRMRFKFELFNYCRNPILHAESSSIDPGE